MNLGNNNVGLIQMRKTVIFQQLYIFQKLDGHALIVQDFALTRSSWQLNRYTSKIFPKNFLAKTKRKQALGNQRARALLGNQFCSFARQPRLTIFRIFLVLSLNSAFSANSSNFKLNYSTQNFIGYMIACKAYLIQANNTIQVSVLIIWTISIHISIKYLQELPNER